jgi:hypothetical protein
MCPALSSHWLSVKIVQQLFQLLRSFSPASVSPFGWAIAFTSAAKLAA